MRGYNALGPEKQVKREQSFNIRANGLGENEIGLQRKMGRK